MNSVRICTQDITTTYDAFTDSARSSAMAVDRPAVASSSAASSSVPLDPARDVRTRTTSSAIAAVTSLSTKAAAAAVSATPGAPTPTLTERQQTTFALVTDILSKLDKQAKDALSDEIWAALEQALSGDGPGKWYEVGLKLHIVDLILNGYAKQTKPKLALMNSFLSQCDGLNLRNLIIALQESNSVQALQVLGLSPSTPLAKLKENAQNALSDEIWAALEQALLGDGPGKWYEVGLKLHIVDLILNGYAKQTKPKLALMNSFLSQCDGLNLRKLIIALLESNSVQALQVLGIATEPNCATAATTEQ